MSYTSCESSAAVNCYEYLAGVKDGKDIYCYVCAERMSITTDGIMNDESYEPIGSESGYEGTCCICGDAI